MIEKYTLGKCTIRIDSDDATNPLEDCDGEGMIYSLNTRHSNFKPPGELMALEKKNPLSVRLSYYEHGQCLWDVQHGERIRNCPDMRWDGAEFAGLWVEDKTAKSNIEIQAYRELLPTVKVNYRSKLNPDGTCITRKPRIGDHVYFADGTVPDARYSNVITWEIESDAFNGLSKGGYKSFANAYRAAAKRLGVVISKPALQTAMRRFAVPYAAGVCKTYTAYCNNECYRYTVTHENGEEDSCGGFLGDVSYCKDQAEEAARYLNAEAAKIEQETQIAACVP